MAQTKAQLIDGKSTSTFTSPIQITGSTSGTVTLQANAVAGTPTLTLPDTTGTLDRLNRAGNILQVVNATYSTGVTTTSSTYVDTGLSASITPSSASSKIIILVSQADPYKASTVTVGGINLRLLRDSTSLIVFGNTNCYTGTVLQVNGTSISCCYLDSPSTTSSVTYKTQFNLSNGTGTVGIQGSGGTSTITLLEVAA